MIDDKGIQPIQPSLVANHNRSNQRQMILTLSSKGLYCGLSGSCFLADFYINDFLLYEDAIEAKDGVGYIGMFLGCWFTRKATWASETSIKENASSLKKFYQYMFEKGLIDEQDLVKLKLTIKEDMPEWLATLGRYNDPSIEDMEEVWGLK